MINVNVGVLGHVDSGKTSLCRCLSEVLSTCALDKHRQSQEKGITIDLGFSSFYLRRRKRNRDAEGAEGGHNGQITSREIPNGKVFHNELFEEEHSDGRVCNGSACGGEVPSGEGSADPLNCSSAEEETLQICLVDCPGHHSLLNCIIMGAEITDMILLLIDITKGIQKQTVECLVLCEVLQRDVVVVLNKIDLVPAEQRERRIKLMKEKIELVFRSKAGLRNLKWYVVGLSAQLKKGEPTAGAYPPNSLPPTDSKLQSQSQWQCRPVSNADDGIGASPPRSENVAQLINLLREIIRVPTRRGKNSHNGGGDDNNDDDGNDRGGDEFYFLYDHTFDIKGKGRAYTGTVIRGTIKRNATVSILPMKEKGKVKEIQSFKQIVNEGTQGNRLSLLICNDHIRNSGKKIERGVIVSEISNIAHFSIFICRVKLVQYYGRSISSSELLSCVIGFSTSPCYGYFFRPINKDTGGMPSQRGRYLKQTSPTKACEKKTFDPQGDYLFINQIIFEQEEQKKKESEENPKSDDEFFFLVILKKKIYCYKKEKCIFIKNEENLNCRICLHGIIEDIVDDGYPHQKTPFIAGKKPTLSDFSRFKNFKMLIEKQKRGEIERVQDDHTVVCRNMFRCSTQVAPYLGKEICLVDADYKSDLRDVEVRHIGVITAPFAKSGKFIAHFQEDLSLIRENYKSFLLIIKYYKDALTKRKVFL
ncbi:selenocysteine-specific elongation factor selB homologue, putative [Plasmodium knowlesi strain H]|uniref:Selenocysteine-specific elongation factor selB homologue, putative n=3 Tax=Plasmodium knowlesi TaxID=5850 RepID=A0A5K1U2N0_PLAKH|nr:selenocysteine-specific elongation factor selb-like protein [Plasmodium knowlesi strain H]OTN66427.1 putative Selenocysteine-specific elongation factor selB-like protein [Plasmodium knowlesi]CAA9986302.1 selenocysteine-specific elongation factor, putative [Plasmodium knowlesi strain H]SBO25532.1 selenocysteine-specific elongation factor selB homologue, putative [Plasmodium knowlesi strain H]SBO28286.1 selenocysteine-specific elongation factor selB homologue, putative [Plasmodium knowlesi str|eukprot:XP_002257708.1 selenocysteine-specific elongation factor selb-like protein [Plasmodium knowlesi strain H]